MRYLLDEVLADVNSGHNIVATVFIQCGSGYRGSGPEEMRPIGESEFVRAIAEEGDRRGGKTKICAGIVSFADLRLPNVDAVLEGQITAAGGRFRGIRHIAANDPAIIGASSYVPPQASELPPRRKKLTIFFSDIANFTETTDSLESEELTNLLNQYLTEMSKIAVSHGATIDKYVGDAIMGFFGDPASRGIKEDAIACVKMAIAMQRRMRELQLTWLDLGSEKPFQLRIGINTGFCTVGNFGSEDRTDYTIIGNEVNLAARLQSHAELGGILVAHETASLIKDTILTDEQEAVSVKGFLHPVRAYRVVGIYDELENDGRIIRVSTPTSTSLSSDTIGASTGTSRSRPCSGSPRTITRRAIGISLAATILAKACRQSDANRDAEAQLQACSRMVQASLKTPAPAALRVRLSSNAKCGRTWDNGISLAASNG